MKIVKTAAVILLSLAVFAGLAAGITASSLVSTFGDSRAAALRTADGDYFNTVHDGIRASVERSCGSLPLDPDVIVGGISFDSVDSCVVDSLELTYARIFHGGEEELPVYENAELFDYIKTALDEYAAENGMAVEEGSAEDVYDHVCRDINAQIHALSENYIKKASVVSGYYGYLGYRWIAYAAAALAAAGIVVIKRKTLFSAFNVALTAAYAGSLIPFVLSVRLVWRGYLDRIILADGTLRSFILRVYNITFGDLRGFSAVFFAVFGVLLLVSIILTAIFGKAPGENKKPAPAEEDRL